MNKVSSQNPWLRYRDTGLYVVPSIHYRQVFAQLVYEACLRKRFDVIAVELPPSFGRMGMVDAYLKMAPAPGLVINPLGNTRLMEVPVDDHPDCKEMEVRPVTAGVMYPFSPCDSIVMALRCPDLLSAHWSGWEPELALIDGEYGESERPRKRLPIQDDYEVIVRGLTCFYERIEESLQSGRDAEVDTQRELIMASHLRRFLDEGKDILFVCGAAHWKNIRRRLDEGRHDVPVIDTRERPHELTLAPIDPSVAWLWGWLDDIPLVAWGFETTCQQTEYPGYDKRESIEDVMKAGILASRAANIPVSIRRLEIMKRFTEVLCSAAGRWIPELDDHLVAGAAACVEDRFSEIIKEEALKFPAPLPHGVSMATVMPADEDSFYVKTQDRMFLLKFPKSESERTRRCKIGVPMDVSESELEESRGWLHKREWPPETKLRRIMTERARALVDREDQTVRNMRRGFVRKFAGCMGDGPDWRRTIRSYATKENLLYVRQSRRYKQSKRGDLSGKEAPDPVVWIFNPLSPIVLRSETYIEPSGHRYCSGFIYVAASRPIAIGQILSFELAALTDLYLSRERREAEKEVDGLTPAQRQAKDDAFIRTIPETKRCSLRPWEDPELRNFHGTNQALAAAIKYASTRVIVVSRSVAPIESSIHKFAEQKGIEITRVSIDDFEQKRLERFQTIHFVPSPVDIYRAPYPWCSRFVPPI